MIGIDEALKATEAAKIVLSATNPDSEATIRVLRQAKYVAAVAMTILASDKPLNDARIDGQALRLFCNTRPQLIDD